MNLFEINDSLMNYCKELQRIYDSEINFTISTDWGAGFQVIFGSGYGNELHEKSWFININEAIEWLIQKVVEFYPESQYAYCRKKMIEKIFKKHTTSKLLKRDIYSHLYAYEKRNPQEYEILKKEYLQLKNQNK
jgi:hypothetical protein